MSEPSSDDRTPSDEPTTAPTADGAEAPGDAAPSNADDTRARDAEPGDSEAGDARSGDAKTADAEPADTRSEDAGGQVAAGAPPASPPAAWGDSLNQLQTRWVRLEVMLSVAIVIAEILALGAWIALKGLSSPPKVSAAGVVFRAGVTATALGLGTWFALNKATPVVRQVATSVAVAAGLFVGRLWAGVGVSFGAELIGWYQDASTLTLIGGLRAVGTRCTIWLAMLGASIATSGGKHINVDVVMRFVPMKLRVPMAVAAWAAAAVVSFAASWGFVEHIAVTSMGAKGDAPMSAKVGAIAHEAGEHLFLLRQQLRIDRKVAWRVWTGERHLSTLTAAEWNAMIDDGGWAERYGADKAKALRAPETTRFVTPIVSIPGGKSPRGILVEDLNLLFPFGFFIIGLKFVLRCLLALSGHVVVDPDAAHRDDDHPPAAQGAAEEAA